MSADKFHYVVYDGHISTKFKLKLVRSRGMCITNIYSHVIVYAQRIWHEVWRAHTRRVMCANEPLKTFFLNFWLRSW